MRLVQLLTEFDPKYYYLIAEKYADRGILNRQYVSVYTVMGEKRLGIVGLFYHDHKPYGVIAIDPIYRGQGLLPVFYKLLMERHGLLELWVYISNDNIASRKSHEKANFVKVDEKFGKSIYCFSMPVP